MPTAAHPACRPPCLPSGRLGPRRLHRELFFLTGACWLRAPGGAQPWPHLEEVWQSPGLPAPQPPASLGAAADKRPPPAGTPRTCWAQTHSPESRGGRGGQGHGALSVPVPEIASRQAPIGNLTGSKGRLIPAANACFSARGSQRCVLGMGVVTPHVRLQSLEGACTPVISPLSPCFLAIPLHRLAGVCVSHTQDGRV